MGRLNQAHNEWANRPSDERFSSLEAFLVNASLDKEAGEEIEITSEGLRVRAHNDVLHCGDFGPLTNWSFGQICRRAKAPADYVGTLPAGVAAQALNYGLDNSGQGNPLILAANGRVRSVTSQRYGRIWDADVASWLFDNIEVGENAWHNPLAYADGNWGGEKVPSGLYRGDRNSFIFLINDSVKVDSGSRLANGEPRMLSRGFFIRGTEVGYPVSFAVYRFLYDYVCGNHFVWGAQLIDLTKVRHIGDAWVRARAELKLRIAAWANESATEQEALFARAHETVIGEDRPTTVGRVSAWTGLGINAVSGAYDIGQQFVEVDGPTNTVWGMTSALTRYAQLSQWTDDRVSIDQAAAQLFVRLAA